MERSYPGEFRLQAAPKNIKELFEVIVASAQRRDIRDLPQDMRNYLGLQGVQVKAEHQGIPDPKKLLIFAPNHHSRGVLFTTGESLNMVALTAVGAFDAEVTPNHTAWIIKQLDIPKVGPGILARRMQNAAITCYGQIPIKVERKLERDKRTGLPRFRDKFANLEQFQGLVFENIMNGNNLGYFPEQKPHKELQLFDPNFPRFIRGIQKITEEAQIVPVANSYEDNVVNVRFGQVIKVTKDSDPSEVARQTMLRIAGNLPRKLRGVYA